MTKAYSYIRFSSPQQAVGESYNRQTNQTLEVVEKYNLELSTEFTFQDLGISGFKGQQVAKGALGKFIQLVDEGYIKPGSWLIVESLDRLGREDINTATARYLDLLNKGITIYTCADKTKHEPGKSGQGAFANLMYSVMVMSRANEESATKSLRGRANWKTKRDLASKGVIVTKMIPSWLEVVDNTIQLVDSKVQTIKQIFELSTKGMGTTAIASYLNKEALPHISNTKRSKIWHSSYIDKILNNSAVYGSLQMFEGRGKEKIAVGEPIENYYPEAVDKATFLRAKQARQSRRIKGTQGKKGSNFSNLLQGIVKCKCGGNMRYSDKGRGLVYLQCSNKINKVNDCNTASYRYDYTEAETLLKIKNYDTNELINKLSKEQALINREAEDKQLMLEADRAGIQKNIDNLVEIIADTGNRNLLKKLNELEEQLQRIKKELNQTPQPVTGSIDYNSKEAMKLIVKVAKGRGTLEQRTQFNNYLQDIIEYIVFGDNKNKAVIRFKDGSMKELLIDEHSLEVIEDFIKDDTSLDFVLEFEDAISTIKDYNKD